MKFYGRVKELEVLRNNLEQSFRNACFTVVIGRRRIGKTMLLMESVKEKKHLYLFVSRKNEQLLCAQFQKTAEEVLGLQVFGNTTTFKDLFEQLLIYSKTVHYTLIIDEFQEFYTVNPAIFGDIQDVWDRHKAEAKINFIVCGSIYAMMTKIFENQKEPLFGRLTSKLILKPFPVRVMKDILWDYNPGYTADDLLCLYMLTGGVAKYVALLMDAKAVTARRMISRTVQPDSPFLGEGRDLLISEFGKEYSTYFSILQLIASGKTTQNEIDAVIMKNTGAYLANLEKEYSLLSKNKPMFAKPESRKIRWAINDNYLQFWFRFIFPNQSLLELGKYDLLREYIDENYKQYNGLVLEKYFREKIAENERVTEVGRYWDNKGKNEIDVIALRRFDKIAWIAEVKRNPKKLDMTVLRLKAENVKKELPGYKIEYMGFSLEDM
jgi:AAA+ ATPase superfamily predicted ATPase